MEATSPVCGTSSGRSVEGAHERPQPEVADRDPDRVERSEQRHRLGLDADLLPRLAQRGRLRRRVGGVHGAAGQRDLAGVGAQVGLADGERHGQLAVGPG